MRVFFFALVLMVFSAHARAQSNIAVLELFTSQGCTYGQKAEGVLERLAASRADNLIVLACHVTVFDDGEYKDPYSLELCDERRRQYRKITGLFGSSGIPMAVVNGRFQDVGTEEILLRSSIDMAHSLDDIVALPMSLREGHLDLTFPKISTDTNLDVWLFAYKKDAVSYVDGGWAGLVKKRLPQVNPVTHAKKLFLWDGRYVTLSVPLSEMEGADGYALIVQDRRNPRIIAAGKVE